MTRILLSEPLFSFQPRVSCSIVLSLLARLTSDIERTVGSNVLSSGVIEVQAITVWCVTRTFVPRNLEANEMLYSTLGSGP